MARLEDVTVGSIKHLLGKIIVAETRKVWIV